MEKKDTAPSQGGIQNAHSNFIRTSNARQCRVLEALHKGPRCREDVDRIAGASNGPEVVRQLRELGWDIPCQLVPHTDRDGKPGKHGVYRLSMQDRLRVSVWLYQRRAQV